VKQKNWNSEGADFNTHITESSQVGVTIKFPTEKKNQKETTETPRDLQKQYDDGGVWAVRKKKSGKISKTWLTSQTKGEYWKLKIEQYGAEKYEQKIDRAQR
jgi:hypothetical protein